MVHIVLSVFEVNRRQHPVSSVLAFVIVEGFDVVEYVLPSIISGFVCPSPSGPLCLLISTNVPHS